MKTRLANNPEAERYYGHDKAAIPSFGGRGALVPEVEAMCQLLVGVSRRLTGGRERRPNLRVVK